MTSPSLGPDPALPGPRTPARLGLLPSLAEHPDDRTLRGPWGHTAESEACYAALADWLAARLDTMAADSADRIWEDLPSYRQDDLHADVRRHIAKIFGVFVTTVREARDPVLDDFAWTAEHARRRVHHGISLVDFLTAFRIAQLTLWEAVLTWTAARPGSEQDVLHLVSHLMRTIEGASAVAARAYLEAQQYDLADLENHQRAVIEELLAGRTPSAPRHQALLREAGLTEDTAYTVASAVLTVGSADLAQEVLARSARTHLARVADGLYALRGSELVAVLPVRGGEDKVLCQRLRRVVDELAGRGITLTAGLGTVRDDLASAAEVYAEASLAREHLTGAPGLAAIGDLSALDYLLTRPDDTARRLVRPRVRAFLSEDLATDGTYAASLRTYVEHDLNAREAARALHVHVNTMYYRLERIADRTGCDLRRVDQVVELLLALKVLEAERA